MYSADSIEMKTMFMTTFSTRHCSTVSVTSTFAQIHLHLSRNTLINCVGGSVSSTKNSILYTYCLNSNAFNSASDQVFFLRFAQVIDNNSYY